ncbi:MAG: hypothetical protein SFX74_05090 [Fimbriimonadaceae bacterium]|nr:hypothetical protein [Fimbriimonadaceae bacterium]
MTHFLTFLLLGGVARTALVLGIVPESGWAVGFGVAWGAAVLVAVAATVGPWADLCPASSARTGLMYLALSATLLYFGGGFAPVLVASLAAIQAGHMVATRRKAATVCARNSRAIRTGSTA